jgi:hypothetical protein
LLADLAREGPHIFRNDDQARTGEITKTGGVKKTRQFRMCRPWHFLIHERCQASTTFEIGDAAMTDGFQSAQPADYAPRTTINYQPSNLHTNATEFLPPGAAERLAILRDHAADAHARLDAVGFDELRELSVEKQKAATRMKQLVGHPQDGGMNLPLENRSVIDAQRQLAKLSDELARLQRRHDERTAAWRSASAVLGAVEGWIRGGGVPGNCLLQNFGEAPEPKRAKNETIVDAVERQRWRVRELKSDQARIAAAPYPASHARAKIKQEIEALALQGAPVVSNVIEHDGGVIWPTQRVRSEVFAEQRGLAFGEMPNGTALLVWLLKEPMLKALSALVDDEADDAAALSIEARQQQEAQIWGI